MKRKLENKYYYFTLFKIVGHETYRFTTGKNKNHLENEIKVSGGKFPKVTEKVIYSVDKITGEIKLTS